MSTLMRVPAYSLRTGSLSRGSSAQPGDPTNDRTLAWPDTKSVLDGRYELRRKVGEGATGVVYEAQQLSIGRRIALKVLPFAALVAPRQLERFKNEARVLLLQMSKLS